MPSVFSTSTVVTQTPSIYPPNTLTNGRIFCGILNNDSYFVWNPSIRKFKLLPTLENDPLYSFDYDHFTDNYKLVAVSANNQVRIYT